MTALAILDELRAAGSSEKAAHLSRFFKTGPGEYGEGDRFLGVTVPVNRAIAKAHIETPIDEIQRLVESEWHEARLCGLLILCYRYKRRKTTDSEREEIVRFYLRNASIGWPEAIAFGNDGSPLSRPGPLSIVTILPIRSPWPNSCWAIRTT